MIVFNRYSRCLYRVVFFILQYGHTNANKQLRLAAKMPRPKANKYRKYFVYNRDKNVSECIVETDTGICGRHIKGDHATNLTHHIKRFHKHLVVVQTENITIKLPGTDAEINSKELNIKCDVSDCPSYDNALSFNYIDPPSASSLNDVGNDAGLQLNYTNAIVSKPAPPFTSDAVVNRKIVRLSLNQFKGKYVVLLFYAMDFSHICPTEIIAYSEVANEFQQLNAQVIAISVDSSLTHLAWINASRKHGGLGDINIPLVSDMSHKICKAYGVYMEDSAHAMRGLFIIDTLGVLRQITINDLRVGRSVNETLRLLKAFQYTDKHEEDCPADWTPGADTVLPHPLQKLKYFNGTEPPNAYCQFTAT